MDQKRIADEMAELDQMERDATAALQALTDEDPYWTYRPSTGDISDEARACLEKLVNPEDRPSKLEGFVDVAKCTKSIIIVSGGNRTGKTTFAVIDAVAQLTGELPLSLRDIYPQEKLPKKWPVYGRHYGVTTDFIHEVLVPQYRQWLPKKYWHKEGWEKTFNKIEKVLRLYEGGSKFIAALKFLTYEQAVGTTQGAKIKFAKFDEVPPEAHWIEAQARFMAGVERMDMAIYATPTEGIGFVEEKLLPRAGVEGQDVAAFEISTLTNPYVNVKAVEETMTGLDYNERLVRMLGQHKSLSGHIYRGKSRITEDHFVKPFPIDWDKFVIFRGLDPHPSKPTHCVELAVDQFDNWFWIGAYKSDERTEEIKKDLARRVVERHYRLAWTRVDKSLDYEAAQYDNINIVDKYRQPPNAIPALFSSEKFKGSIDAGIEEFRERLFINPVSKKPRMFFFDNEEGRAIANHFMRLERKSSRNEDKNGMRDAINEGNLDFHAAARYVAQGRPLFFPEDRDEQQTFETERYI